MDTDSIQYSCTVLVLIQLHPAISMDWDSTECSYTELVLIQTIFIDWDSFQYLFTDLVLIQSLCKISQPFLHSFNYFTDWNSILYSGTELAVIHSNVCLPGFYFCNLCQYLSTVLG